MATTNFLQMNNAAINQETDAQFSVDPIRTGGAAVTGELPSPLFNKFAYQASTFYTAFCQMMANKGFSTSDADINVLSAVLANIQTSADQVPNFLNVPYSPTPTYNAALASGFWMSLTGNVALQNIINPKSGQLIALYWHQDSVGGRTVTFPANVQGGVTPAPQATESSMQLFRYDDQVAVYTACSPLMDNSGNLFTSGTLFGGALSVPGSISGNSLEITGSASVGGTVTAPTVIVSGSTSTGALTSNTTIVSLGDMFCDTEFHATSAVINTSLQAATMHATSNIQVDSNLQVNANANLGSLQVGGAQPVGYTLVSNGSTMVPTRGATGRVTNANGSYRIDADGTITCWGSVAVGATGNEFASCSITFPHAFSTSMILQVTVLGLPSPSAHAQDVAVAVVETQSLSGATIFLQCPVPTGGGGATFDVGVTVQFQAVGF